jgi:hypothetical protein
MSSRRVVSVCLGMVLVLSGLLVNAKETKEATKKTKATAGKSAAPPGVTLNACGCYRKGSACVCTDRKAKCECPDDCEPVGCEEKRQKEMDREMAAEVKHAQEEDKKREAAEAARAKEAADKENREAEAHGQESDDQANQPTDDEKATPKPAKPAHKDREKK